MAKLTAEEIQRNLPQAVEVGTGLSNGMIVQVVRNGHIVDTYAETRKRPKQHDHQKEDQTERVARS